jgi:hypothetical protein
MAKTLQQIIGGDNLCGVIEGVKPGLSTDLLPPEFFNLTKTVDGDTGKYTKVNGNRKTARLVQYGSPAKNRELTGLTEVPVKLMHSLESVFHHPSVLMNLLSVEGAVLANGMTAKQKLGADEIARQTRDFAQLFQNLRTAAIFSALFKGAVYFDGEGNLLPSSSGAVVTVDFGIPAGNQNQLDVDGNGAIIGASWATAGTEIHTDVQQLKIAARKLTGYPLQVAFYGENILNYFVSNTYLSSMIIRKQSLQDAFAANMIPDGFLGIQKWIPGGEAFFEDKDGTVQGLLGADNIVFTPMPDRSWYELLEGTYPVPTDIGEVSSDALSAAQNLVVKPGMFSYAVRKTNPVTIEHVAGDTVLPVIKVPAAIFIADVTP